MKSLSEASFELQKIFNKNGEELENYLQELKLRSEISKVKLKKLNTPSSKFFDDNLIADLCEHCSNCIFFPDDELFKILEPFRFQYRQLNWFIHYEELVSLLSKIYHDNSNKFILYFKPHSTFRIIFSYLSSQLTGSIINDKSPISKKINGRTEYNNLASTLHNLSLGMKMKDLNPKREISDEKLANKLIFEYLNLDKLPIKKIAEGRSEKFFLPILLERNNYLLIDGNVFLKKNVSEVSLLFKASPLLNRLLSPYFKPPKQFLKNQNDFLSSDNISGISYEKYVVSKIKSRILSK